MQDISIDLPGRSKQRVVFMYISSQLIPEDATARYYSESYSLMDDGMYLPPHFMEIPYWVVLIDRALPKNRFDSEFYVVTDAQLSQTKTWMAMQPAGTIFMFSVMDANLPFVKELAATRHRIVAGGYVNAQEFDAFPNVSWFSRIEDLNAVINDPAITERSEQVRPPTINSVPNYELFAGSSVIARMTLSTGCNFGCSYCTVETDVLETDPHDVEQMVDALRPLKFRYVFLDDKSYGQAANSDAIVWVAEKIRQFNPDFAGFIVQTPPSLAIKDRAMEKWAANGVKMIEFGVEIVDDTLLAEMSNPYRTKQLYEAMDLAREVGMQIIPNIIIGIPREAYDQQIADYRETVEFFLNYSDVIPVVNFNWYSTHADNALNGKTGRDGRALRPPSRKSNLPYKAETPQDADQNQPHSRLTSNELSLSELVRDTIMRITLDRARGATRDEVWGRHGQVLDVLAEAQDRSAPESISRSTAPGRAQSSGQLASPRSLEQPSPFR